MTAAHQHGFRLLLLDESAATSRDALFLTYFHLVLGIVWPRTRLLIVLNFSFSTIAATAVSTLAVTLTGAVLSTANMINSFGSGLSLNVKIGVSFLAIIWVSTVLAVIANFYWFIVWFVEFRKTAFSRRSRTQNQIGDWSGILREVRRDIKTDGHFPPPKEYGGGGSHRASKEERPANE